MDEKALLQSVVRNVLVHTSHEDELTPPSMSTVSPGLAIRFSQLPKSVTIMLTVNEPVRDQHERKGAHVAVRTATRVSRRREAHLDIGPDGRLAKLIARSWPRHLQTASMACQPQLVHLRDKKTYV